jgi:hypothetical protein
LNSPNIFLAVRTGIEPVNVVINQRLVVGYTGFNPRIITPFAVRSATHIESYLIVKDVIV